MEVFRICLEKYSSSLAASGNEARWNSKGRYVIYTAQSRSLACLENLVHRKGLGLSVPFSVITIKIPDNTKVEIVELSSLPKDWNLLKNYHFCQKIGESWSANKTSLLLKVPSSIINEESNFLINPLHPEFASIKIISTKIFTFDERLR